MKTVSLRRQINLRILLASLSVLLLGVVLAVWQARQSVQAELDSALNLATQLIQLTFREDSSGGKIRVDDWLPHFVSLQQTRNMSIELKQADGTSVNFSGDRARHYGNAPPKWFMRLLSVKLTNVEHQLTSADGKPASLVIQVNPIDEMSEAWQESCGFLVTLAVMTAITFMAVNLLFGKTLRTITVIVEALKNIERGDYQQKLPNFAIQEYDNIAKAINHMTSVLDETYQENKALTQHTLQIQEAERQALAKELHDELGQSLTAIKVMATTSKSDKANRGEIADTIIAVCDHLVIVVRSMMRHLHPLVLSELGLKACLEDLLNHWTQRSPQLNLNLNCPDKVEYLGQNVSIQVFRIVQECLTNIVRHANADEASVNLSMSSGQMLCLEIVDNGEGCDWSETKKGFGLLGIRERITSLGGELTIQTAYRQGMKISANIPLT